MPHRSARVTVAILLSAACLAGIRAAGKYTGVVVFDRWGGCVLSAGTTLNYVTEAEKGSLKPYDGRTVMLDVSETHQPINPGEALIKKFRRISPAAELEAGDRRVEPLRLSVKAQFADGQPAAFTITARNVGEAPVTLDYSFLSPVVLMKRRDNRNTFFDPADGPSIAVMTSLNFWIGPDDGPRLQSTGVQSGVRHEWRVTNVATLPRQAVLKPGTESVIRMSLSLPPGEYDFFAAYYEYHPTPWYVASNLVGFDVAADGRATLPKVPGR